jgi:hypothetical protein
VKSRCSPRRLQRFADGHGLTIELAYGTDYYLDVYLPLRPVAERLVRLVGWLSGGRLSSDHANIGLVLRKASS